MKIAVKKSLQVKRGVAVIAPVFKKVGFSHVVDRFPSAAEWLDRRKRDGDFAIALAAEGVWLMLPAAGDPAESGEARKLAKKVILGLRENRIAEATLFFPPGLQLSSEFLANLVDYLHLNHYAFDRYQKKKKAVVKRIAIVAGKGLRLPPGHLAKCERLDEVIRFYRDLVNEPPSKVNPDHLVEALRRRTKASNLGCEVWRRKELQERNMNGLLAVGAGGCCEPAMVQLSYNPPTFSRTVAVVGKGITFDSGGLDIKPPGPMEEMKCDMAGAALALAIVEGAAVLRLPIRVLGFAAVAENMPGSRAYKPGDIITYANGKTVEIANTDAEGRLILADALIEAARSKPSMIVEFSTLTGAIVVALGDSFAGLMTKNRHLASMLLDAGRRTGEFLWEMPLFEEYAESIRSKVADLKNSGYQGAGAVKAGLFLHEFVGRIPFAHIDIAGTAFLSKPNHYFAAEGASGFGVRLMIAFLESMAR